MKAVVPTPTQMMYAYVRTVLEVATREIWTAVTANSGTSEQAIRLHRIATPKIPVTLSLKNAATCSGVSVGASGGENTGNRKYASTNSATAGGAVHNRMRWPRVFIEGHSSSSG